jgi:8-oxo-dGTP pyrophosphatase MutT (NUDIX family)
MASSGIAAPGRARDDRFGNASILRWQAQERIVVAAICYRFRDGDVEFLLVRTRGGRWTFPKGAFDRDPSFAAAAAREAYEEAGVIGRVYESCLTRYVHGSRNRGPHPVYAHLCEVMHLEPSEEAHRVPTWFSATKAKRRLREDRPQRFGEELERVVDAAVRSLTN